MTIRRILIYRYGQLGDTLVALPALWLLRKRYPAAFFVLLSEQSRGDWVSPQAILPKNSLIDEYWTYGIPASGTAMRTRYVFSLARRIRNGRFDALIYLAPTLRQSPQRARRDLLFFRMLAGIRVILGHTGADTIPPKVEGKPLPLVRSETDSLLDRLAASAFKIPAPNEMRYDLALTDEELDQSRVWLAKAGVTDTVCSRAVAIGIGGKWPSKLWPIDYFEKLGHRLVHELDLVPVIFGGPEDRRAAEQLVGSWERGAVAAGALGVRDAAAVMAGMAFFIGNDTGTMHLAAAAGLRCVGIFSAQDWPGRWSPFGQGHEVLRHRVPCEGCLLTACSRMLECLYGIEPDQVFNACKNVLQKIR